MAILDRITVNLNLDKVRKKLHMKPESDVNQVRSLIDTVQQLIEPKAIYNVSYIDEKLEDSVVVGGLTLKSGVLRKNLDRVERFFPYVMTLGRKLGEKQNTCSDLIENYYLDCIGNLALTLVQKQLKKHLQSKFALEKLSSMAPGSLSDWPIEEQEPLFGLLGDVEASIGVRLTRNLLMMPAKSISGLYFPTEVSFYSCQLCPRKRCESRKAKYNEALAGKYGIQNQT
ncbi:MAG: vitamin B12 dependent-methionine synthase activation domain-containing protein [Desulfobacterales bacterium]